MPAAVVEGNNDSTLGWLADFVVRQEGVAVSPAIFDQPPIAAPMLPVVPPPVIPTPAMPGASSPVARIDFKARDQRRHEEFNALPDRLARYRADDQLSNGSDDRIRLSRSRQRQRSFLSLSGIFAMPSARKRNFPEASTASHSIKYLSDASVAARQEAVDRIAPG